MKRYNRDNYKPFEAEIFDINGETYIIRSTPMTTRLAQKEKKIHDDKELNESDRLVKLSTLYFGKDEEFWNNVEVALITDIINDYIQFCSQKKNTSNGLREQELKEVTG